MAIRTYKVILDSKNSIAPEPLYFRQGDKTGAVTIDASVTDNGIPVPLDGLTPTFRANTADGKAVIVDGSNFTITDAANGRFTYRVPNALGAEPGKVKNAYFTFSDADGVESTFSLVFIIQPSVDMTQEQAKDYITIVDGIFKDYQNKLSSTYNSYKSQTDSVFKSFQDQVNSTFNNFQNQVKTSTDNMNNELKQLSDKTDGLNTNIQQALANFNQGDFYNKSETDSRDASTLTSAKSYADTKDTTVLTSAKAYADNVGYVAPQTAVTYHVTQDTDSPIQFWREGHTVFLQGSGNFPSSGTIWYIPEGFRPSKLQRVSIQAQNSAFKVLVLQFHQSGETIVVFCSDDSSYWLPGISWHTNDPMPS